MITKVLIRVAQEISAVKVFIELSEICITRISPVSQNFKIPVYHFRAHCPKYRPENEISFTELMVHTWTYELLGHGGKKIANPATKTILKKWVSKGYI